MPDGFDTALPISIFSNDLSALEAVVKYLKEEKQLRFCEIAKLLNRDDRTIWDAYDGATKKQPGAHSSDSKVQIPLSIFTNRTLSMLESVTAYLKEVCNLRFCNIAALLNKDARTIWTVYSRIQKKRSVAIESSGVANAIHSVAEETGLARERASETGTLRASGLDAQSSLQTHSESNKWPLQLIPQHNTNDLQDLNNERKQ